MPRSEGIPEVQHYIFDHDAPAEWTGPVVRRDPATYQLPSIVKTWRCASRHCREWTSPFSHEPDRCNHCGRKRTDA